MKKAAQATPNQLLSRERERRGWSQQDVADQIGTTPVNISRWERGLTSPSPYFRHKLCEIFGKSPQELGLVQETVSEDSESSVQQAPAEQQTAFPASVASSVLWNLPHRRNPFFTGREDILMRLHDTLASSKVTALTQAYAISGLGGIGKTQTAIEYAYRYRENYQAVLWTRADTREVLISDLAALASLLNLPEKNEQNQSRTVEAVKRWLNEHGEWLLILDNIDEIEMASDFLPTAGSGHILLTTRAQATGTIAQSIELEQMEPEEGALFLLRRAKVIARDAPLDNASYADWTKSKAIAQLMDGLPLALDQAAAYIEETGCSLAGYLTLYRTRRTRLLKRRGRLASDHPEPVTTTWSLSFENVAQANPAAADLLRLCAFLHPDAIPEEIIVEGAPDLGPAIESVAADPLELDAAIEELRKYSLLRRNPDSQTLTIHRLVQAVLRDQVDEDAQRRWAERTVRAVSRIFPEVEFATWQRCQRYSSQALACAALIEQWDMAFPEAAQLLKRAGNYLREHGQYQEAEPLLKQALAIYEQTMEPQHPDVASCLNDLATLYWNQGKYAQAEPLFRQALTIREQTLGSEHPDVATSLNDLALLYWEQGKYAQAEPLYHRALAIREQILGPEHSDVAQSLNNLGILYLAQGKYAAAEVLLQRSLAIWERMLGPNHPQVAYSLNNLAFLYYTQGRYKQAEPLYLRALAIREQALGPEHDEVALVLDNLALVYTDQGRYLEAEPLFQRALAIREQALGPEHHYVARTLHRLARLYYAQGKYAQAEPLLIRSLTIREQALGPDHPDVAYSLDTLALLSLALGKSSQAELLARRALAIRERILEPEHPDVATSLNTLAQIYFAQGRYAQAEPLFIRALAIREQALGPDHPDVAESLEHYADLLRKTNRESEASELESRARTIRAR